MSDIYNGISSFKCCTDSIESTVGCTKIIQDNNTIIISIDYYKKYNELLVTIRQQLRYLEPWYQSGKVGSPMDAVTALRNIDKAVSQ